MEKEAAKVKKSALIQQEFSQVCMELGDCMAKIRRLEETQDVLNAKWLQALEEEKEVIADSGSMANQKIPADDTVTNEVTEQN